MLGNETIYRQPEGHTRKMKQGVCVCVYTFLRLHQVATIVCKPKAHAVKQISSTDFFVLGHRTLKYCGSSVLGVFKSRMLQGNGQNRGTAYMRFVALQCQNYNAA